MDTAYVVKLDKNLQIKTVSDSEITAIVNGLMVVFGVMVRQGMPEDSIRVLWNSFCDNPAHEVHVVRCMVIEVAA